VSQKGYVPGLEWDVFVSYAHVSDQPDRWVSRFRDELKRAVSAALDHEARIWFDAGCLTGGDEIKGKIQADLRRTAVMVPVVSPGYLRSEFCTIHELEWYFSQGAGQVVPVLKIPLEEGQVLPLPPDLKRIEFYQISVDNYVEFDPDEEQFAQKLRDVAQAIVHKLRQMRKSRQRIYLSQPNLSTADALLKRVRGTLLDEFHGQGFRVLPDQIIFSSITDDQIRAWQEKSDVVVLLRPADSDPLTERQVVIARELDKTTIMGVTNLGEAGSTASTEPAVLLTGSGWREEIIRRVQQKLRPEAAPAPAAPGRRDLYLLCSPEDFDQSWELRNLILRDTAYADQYRVLLPEFALRDPFKFQKDHDEKLKASDGVLLYWGSAEKSWFESQDEEVLPRAIGWLRKRSYLAEAKYISAPEAPDKLRVEPKRGEFVIRRFGPPRLDDLRPFLSALQLKADAAQGSRP